MNSIHRISDDEKRVVDTFALLGLHTSNFVAYNTGFIEDSLLAQELYHYADTISRERTLDQPRSSKFVVQFVPYEHTNNRLKEWYDATRVMVPEDFEVTPTMVGLLVKANGRRRGDVLELQTPPLDRDGALRVRESLGEQSIEAMGGEGIDSLRFDSTATERLSEYAHTPSEVEEQRAGKYDGANRSQ